MLAHRDKEKARITAEALRARRRFRKEDVRKNLSPLRGSAEIVAWWSHGWRRGPEMCLPRQRG